MPNQRPQTLIESWFPFATVGAESLRESGFPTPFPAPVRLHVWWARRPLTISRAAIVASSLPDYESIADDPDLRERFPDRAAYHAWFLRLLGIYGDPVETRKRLRKARETGKYLGSDPYGYDRAFTTSPRADDLALLGQVLAQTWDVNQLQDLTVLDPFAGGGSIPFEARRYGFSTVANELNPVAAVILTATLDYPARFGSELSNDIKRWGQKWVKRVRAKLAPFYPKGRDENIFAYLWARTVACPVTGKPVPLSPNWWLGKGRRKGRQKTAVRVLTDPAWDEPRFEIVRGDAIDFDPNEGTVSRGVGRSPWTGDAIDGDYIKAEAQAGRMGQMLYAIALKESGRGGFGFRLPTADDLEAVLNAEEELARKRPLWETQGLIPTEPIPNGLKTPEPKRYGMDYWTDLFNPRQLLALGTLVEVFNKIKDELSSQTDQDHAKVIETYLSVMLNKSLIYNNRACRFDPTRGLRSIFDRHDFAFVWSHGEFDASANLLPWAVDQITDAYQELAELLALPSANLEGHTVERGALSVLQNNAADVSALPDGSVDVIVTDPPYYDNVMYAELSDFFYVWLKRTVGHLYPEWFAAHLTDKDAEAVANPARFADLDKSKRKLAAQDYERKMAAAFREMHRVLRDDGVLTVMFTHKQVEAWDTLATALIGAGFSVESSWPVHTESRHSLHQAKKNAARSTVLLTCRKRLPPPVSPPMGGTEGGETGGAVWWDDIRGEVRRVARAKATAFSEQGIEGVDLYLSTFGPALSVISRHWPVFTREVDEHTGEPKPLRPERALDLARKEVVQLRKRGLLLGREVQFDPLTDWYLMAWDAFRAARFPADEARKLALALGLDVESDLVSARVIGKKYSDVVLLTPKRRRARGRADPEAETFDTWLDAAHTALLVYIEDGAAACEAFLKRTGLRTDSTFKACLQAMLNAVPRTRVKGKFARPEAEALDRLRLAFFEELEVPPEETGTKPQQLALL